MPHHGYAEERQRRQVVGFCAVVAALIVVVLVYMWGASLGLFPQPNEEDWTRPSRHKEVSRAAWTSRPGECDPCLPAAHSTA